ncbi:forkhead box protein D2 [Alosa alosa]|uniref:forkhead box protein D2 n=1 Tax=Alosa alosa TaxID=278164 RepID=UPI0020152AF1|nr:forkhead box protein D2 [Alosa alosa]
MTLGTDMSDSSALSDDVDIDVVGGDIAVVKDGKYLHHHNFHLDNDSDDTLSQNAGEGASSPGHNNLDCPPDRVGVGGDGGPGDMATEKAMVLLICSSWMVSISLLLAVEALGEQPVQAERGQSWLAPNLEWRTMQTGPHTQYTGCVTALLLGGRSGGPSETN